MRKRGYSFEFDPPENWTERKESSRLIFVGPVGQQLIVSGWVIQGSGTKDELATVREGFFQRAVQAVQNTVSDPELIINSPLAKYDLQPGLGCWVVFAQTRDSEVFLGQAIITNERGIMLVTLEGPNNTDSLDAFYKFLQSIESLYGEIPQDHYA